MDDVRSNDDEKMVDFIAKWLETQMEQHSKMPVCWAKSLMMDILGKALADYDGKYGLDEEESFSPWN